MVSILGLPLVHQIELLLEHRRAKRIDLGHMEILDIVFEPWRGSNIDLSSYLFPESELGCVLIQAFLDPHEYMYSLPEELSLDLWDNKVVKPFLARYSIS